jgi:hypothetical protein
MGIRILFFICVSSIFLNAFNLIQEAQITSNYIYRGISQTNNTPALSMKFILKQSGFYSGVWASRVKFDTNDTSFMKILDDRRYYADSEVDVFYGYEFLLGSNSLGFGYLDKRYFVNNTLQADISTQYFGYIGLDLGVNTIIKASYDIHNVINPLVVELLIKNNINGVRSSFIYGWHIQNKNRYWSSSIDIPILYFSKKSMFSFMFSRFMPIIGKQVDDFVISYRF